MKNPRTAAPIPGAASNEEPKDLFAKGREFLEMYNKVAAFTKELMDQNAQLREQIRGLQTERERILGGAGDAAQKRLLQRLEELKQERQQILDRYHQKEEENKDFYERFREIELENNNLANLYVASYQLHSTLDFQEVLDVITEIIINLIGAQAFVIWLREDKKEVLEPVKVEGLGRGALAPVTLGEGIIGSVAAAGEIWYREQAGPREPITPDQPLVCVPLKIKEQVIGAISVYQLLPQKERLVKVDYELFTLLAAHAATAIFGARLYSDSVRKRKTIKGFLDLLTH